MKATKLIKQAVENNLNVSINACTVLYQGKIWGETKETTYDAAIIYINGSVETYAIRAWHTGQTYIEEVKGLMKDAFKKIILLN